MTKLSIWLMQACRASNLQIDPGFVAVLDNGLTIQTVARIRGIGDKNGTLIFIDHKSFFAQAGEVVRAGYGFTVLGEPREDEDFDFESFQSMFRDWGWSG